MWFIHHANSGDASSNKEGKEKLNQNQSTIWSTNATTKLRLLYSISCKLNHVPIQTQTQNYVLIQTQNQN
jgi:Txe/YoeB family toxin of Txe-Axe toxin-antitoxin module